MTVNTEKMDNLDKCKVVPYNSFYMKDYTQEQKEDLYWDIIAAYDWDNNCREVIEQVQMNMLTRFDSGILIAASEFARGKQGDLHQVVDAFENNNGIRCGEYGGDDSFGDMLSHVVSMGKEFYDKVFNDPSVLNDGFQYRECFSYVLIDSDDDVRKFDVYYHRRHAYELWGYLNYHKDYYINEDAETWSKLAVIFDKVLAAIGEHRDDEGDMDLLWEAVGAFREKSAYREHEGLGYKYPNILQDMCRCLFDWDAVGEVQLEFNF